MFDVAVVDIRSCYIWW